MVSGCTLCMFQVNVGNMGGKKANCDNCFANRCASIVCCWGPTHSLWRCSFGLEWSSGAAEPVTDQLPPAFDSNHSTLFPAGLPLVFCSHSVLTGVCTPGLLFVCYVTLWIINEGKASPKLKNRGLDIDKNVCERTVSRFSCKYMNVHTDFLSAAFKL